MNILYSSDENYSKISMVSIASLLENNEDVPNINIYYIDAGLSESSKSQINNLVNKFSRNIYFLSAEKIDVSFIAKTGFPIAGYYRLFISKLINVDKIIYLDSDTIVLDSLSYLWDTDISNMALGGVKDTVQDFLATGVNMNSNSNYINSGVMLINLKYWRKHDSEKKIKEFFENYNGKVPHHDQGIINGVFKDKVQIIDPKYNVMSQFYQFKRNELQKMYNINNFYSKDEINQATNKPVIVHYLNKFYGRPWEVECSHPYANKFNEIAKKYNIEINKKESSLTSRIKIRKYLYKYTPFYLYSMYERLMDIKRKKVFYESYKRKN